MGSYTVSGSGADCKSAAEKLGWFDSITAHHIYSYVVQSVEPLTVNQVVTSSSLVVGAMELIYRLPT